MDKKVLYGLFILVILAISAAALSACGNTKVTSDGSTVTTTGTPGAAKTTVVSADGQQKVVIEGGANTGGWCPAGGDWKMTATGAQGGASATMKIDKLMTSGKYSGMCHVFYTVKTDNGNQEIEYYFDESGKNGYMIFDADGQKMEQEFHS
jgi:hypothetical protein